jgi:hypothetical protein
MNSRNRGRQAAIRAAMFCTSARSPYRPKPTSTLRVELEADNANGALLPGGYTEVHFRLPIAEGGVRVSANALLFRAEGPQIAAAGPDGPVVLHAVTLGRAFGTAIEVLTGIAPGDAVVPNPPPRNARS